MLVCEQKIRDAMKAHCGRAPVLMIQDPDDPSVGYFNVLVSQCSYIQNVALFAMSVHSECHVIYNVATLVLHSQEWGFTVSIEDAFDWLQQAQAHETGHRKGKSLYAYICYNKGYQMNITRDLCNFISMCC